MKDVNSNSTTTLVFAAVVSLFIGVTLGIQWEKQTQKRQMEQGNEGSPTLAEVAKSIHCHMRTTQAPSRLLDMKVDNYIDNETLVLSAPVKPQNANVHGTAFCGSLYSVAALSSYYLGREWMLRAFKQEAETLYVLVGRQGRMQYKVPVMDRIVAQSTLPDDKALETFRNELVTQGKSYLDVDGKILLEDGTVACEFSFQLCAYRRKL
jgi:thioesterase domain-containing protein